MSTRPAKTLNSALLLRAYHQGQQDRLERKAPRPPAKGPARTAYLNGYRAP